MNSTKTSNERDRQANVREREMDDREQSLTNREAWVRAREAVTGEHDVVAHDREEAIELREEALRVREVAEQARNERDHLLVQMREANERLIGATLRADALAEQAVTAKENAAKEAALEAKGRVRAEVLATQLRKSEEALRISEARARENDRAKDELLAMLGYELRLPLTAIQDALDLIAQDPAESHRDALDVIGRQLQQLARIIDMLDGARTEPALEQTA